MAQTEAVLDGVCPRILYNCFDKNEHLYTLSSFSLSYFSLQFQKSLLHSRPYSCLDHSPPIGVSFLFKPWRLQRCVGRTVSSCVALLTKTRFLGRRHRRWRDGKHVGPVIRREWRGRIDI